MNDIEKKHLSLEQLNTLIETQTKYPDVQWILSRPGGNSIQGSPSDLLHQSSILAEPRSIQFSDGITRPIPSCYYEFAFRRKDPVTQKLFQGFVAKNADKLFESTDVKAKRT